MRPGKRRELDKANNPIDALIDKVEKLKARIRAKVEHPFRVIKRQFGFAKVRYRGLKKNTLQLKTLFTPVDGQAPFDGNAGTSAFESSKTAPEQCKNAPCPVKEGPEKPELKAGNLI